MSVWYCQNLILSKSKEDSSMLYWKRRRCFKWPVGEVKMFVFPNPHGLILSVSAWQRPVLRPFSTAAGHICVYDSIVRSNTEHCGKKTANNEPQDMTFRETGGRALDTVTTPLKWTKHKHTKSDLERGKRGILYMLSYKWCFDRRLLTKTTVPFWCETVSDQNPAKPVGRYYRTPYRYSAVEFIWQSRQYKDRF